MYYELIKMLIDYERRNHPETYDATKTVGKIEGYQELTNKLQRYLNQRFIVDIDQLGKEQQSITNMFSSNTEFLQKFEALELNFINLNEKNQTLMEHVENVEKANKSLLEEITALKDKDNEITLRQQDYEDKHQEDVSIIKVTLAETNSHFEKTSKELEADCQRVEETLTNLLNQQKEDLDKKVNAKVELLSEDLEKINAQQTDTIKRIETDEDRIEVLENAGPEITKNLVGELDGKMKELQGNTNNTLKTIEEKINTNTMDIEQNKEEQKMAKEETNKIAAIQTSVTSQLEELDQKSEEAWRSVEEVLAGRQKDMVQLQATVDGHAIRMGQVEEEARGIRTQVDNVQKVAEASGVSAAEVLSKMAVQVRCAVSAGLILSSPG